MTHAFDVFPEFHSLSEAESTRLDETTLIDSEYESDVITYLNPLQWDPWFFSQSEAFDFTIGSLSGYFFQQRSRLKVENDLSDLWQFRFTYFSQRDLDTDQTHAVLELVRELSPSIAISLYGEPSMLKRENDVGLAILVKPSENHTLRLFHTWVDFTRGSNNNRPDRFVSGSEARAMGFVGRFLPSTPQETWWLEYFARIETPVRWLFPQSEGEFQYQSWTAGLNTRFRLSADASSNIWNLRVQASNKEEAFRALSPASGFRDSSLERKRVEALSSLEMKPFESDRISFEPGLGWFSRNYQGEDRLALDHQNLMPFAWIHFTDRSESDSQPNVTSVGYEATFFRSNFRPNETTSLASQELKAWAVEHRLNSRYTIGLKGSSVLTIALTADLDAAVRGSGGLFEGGNGQFRSTF